LRWAVRRILSDDRFSTRSGQIAAWARAHDGAEQGVALVEPLAG
jgi:UDP:flavonoid glycosyltransferase YjiC (YdhE family)